MNPRFASTAAATALLVCAGKALAQTSVTVYGIVDTGLEYQRASAGSTGPATTTNNVVSGTFSASRIGFRGSEDLGGGLRAFFQLESGITVNDGTTTGPAFFGRKSIVGLGGPWGELWFGRDYTPAFWAQFYTDANRFAMYGNSGTMSAFALTRMLRASNGIFYASPEYKGFRGRLTYTFGDERTTPPKDAGRVAGVSGEYRSPTWSAGAYHQERRVVFPAGSSTSDKTVFQGLMALYDFGGWSASGGYTRIDPAGPNTATGGVTRSLWGSVLVKLGSSDLRLNIGRATTDVAVSPQGETTIYGINYSYQLSKRTNLYVGVGQANNNESAQLGLEGASRPIPNHGLGSDTTAATAGMRMTF